MSDIVHLSGRTHLAYMARTNIVDLDAERMRRAQHAREARLAGRRPDAPAARRSRSAPDPIGYPALGGDGPGAA